MKNPDILVATEPVPEAMHNKEAGFTLIEVIVTMLIAGILATIAGLGIVQGVKGYVFASENAAITQKAELSMARMSLELRDVCEVTYAEELGSEIRYKSVENPEVEHTIKLDGLDGSEITLDSNMLIDEVSDLILSYKKRTIDGNEENWNKDINPIEELVIHIDLILEHTDPDIPDITFTTKINPRNTF